MRPPRSERDPWARSRVGELAEPLLPRWFVLLAVAMVPVALVVFVVAFFLAGGGDVAVTERRPPPAAGLTHEVGEVLVGQSEPVRFDGACAAVDGLRVAGTESDRALLRQALARLCNVGLPEETTAALTSLAERRTVVRFAAFEATGVDSVADLDGARILVNARFAQAGRAEWVASLIVHDAVLLSADPAAAEAALAARRAEAQACEELQQPDEPSRGCEDARALLALDDPLAELREAGYR